MRGHYLVATCSGYKIKFIGVDWMCVVHWSALFDLANMFLFFGVFFHFGGLVVVGFPLIELPCFSPNSAVDEY